VGADPSEIMLAAERLRAGGLVAFPTETVYGLGADALSPEAVARVFALKGRPATNPLIVHIADAALARSLAGDWPDEAERLAAAFWPGPLTIVVPASTAIPRTVTAGGPTVALRVPDHPVALSLLGAFGGPLVGPSANPSGRTSPTTAAHVRSGYPDLMVLDGGTCRTGIESTVIALSPSPRILRPGIITADVIARTLGRPVEYSTRTIDGPAQSPGLQRAHYAPAAPAVLCDQAQLEILLAGDQPIAVLTARALDLQAPHRLIRMPATPAAYAAALYASLRAADAGAPALIAIERPQTDSREAGLWLAVMDRLSRATASAP
jgi:L-threonylcarbamoyladenylate synthase